MQFKQFKLKTSTSEGQRANKDSSQGPKTPTNISVVDHRGVFFQVKIFHGKVEAKCDVGASASCLSDEIYNSLKAKHSLKLQTSLTQLKAANQLPIGTIGVVCLPERLGKNKIEHNFTRFGQIIKVMHWSRKRNCD